MPLSLKHSFKNATLLAAALTLGGVFGAPMANAEAPPQGSPQWNLMHPYAGFITRMKTHGDYMYNTNGPSVYGGWCCSWADGRGDMPERWVPGPGGNQDTGHYQVFALQKDYSSEYSDLLSHETYNGQLGKWIDIPPANVIQGADAHAECEAIKRGESPDGQGDPTKEQKDTCVAPPFNILWISSTGLVYCYWPLPKLGMNNHVTPSENKGPQVAHNQSAPATSVPAPAL